MTAEAQQPPRIPWVERWHEPTLEGLVGELKEHHRRAIEHLFGELESLSLEQRLRWYGPSWRWTVEYAPGADAEAVCYIVPDPDGPRVHVPLPSNYVEKASKKKLNKYVREGLSVAKHAFENHWCCWTPNNPAEGTYIKELLEHYLGWLEAPKSASSGKRAKS